MNKGFLSPKFHQTTDKPKTVKSNRWTCLTETTDYTQLEATPIKWLQKKSEIPAWVQSYFPGLKEMDQSTVYCVSKLENSRGKYSDRIVNLMSDCIEKYSFSDTIQIPGNLAGTGFAVDYFLGSLIHCRSFNSENDTLQLTLAPKTLFLVTANVYERTPLRNYFSRMDDSTLRERYGMINGLTVGDVFQNRRQFLDTFSACVLSQWPYVTIDVWQSPGLLAVHEIYDISNGYHRVSKYTLHEFTKLYPKLHPMTKLRLFVTFVSNSDYHSLTPWKRLIDTLYKEYPQLLKFYKTVKENPENTILTKELSFPTLAGFEDPIDECVLCKQVRPMGSFSECGHGTCVHCHVQYGLNVCPFCNEHFTCPSITLEAIEEIGHTPETEPEEVSKLKAEKLKRGAQFDFANGQFKLPI